MSFLIDGYNFLFRLRSKKGTLERQREHFIQTLNQALSFFQRPVQIVFDSSEQFHHYAQKAKLDHLEIIYAPKGKTADGYIIELIELCKNRKIVTVVTSDSGLTKQCQHLGATTESIEDFLKKLGKKKKQKEKPNYTESEKEIERLLRIFEDRS